MAVKAALNSAKLAPVSSLTESALYVIPFGCKYMEDRYMTEKEKGLCGQLYNPNNDESLQREMMSCKDLCMRYNQISTLETQKRHELLGQIFGAIKGQAMVLSPFHCDYGKNISVGENFFANHNLVILDGAKISFGDNVFIGPNCCFSTAGHPVDSERRNRGLEFAYPITIGNNVWFGAGVMVLPGVTIGDNAVIGAGSVVTKDIPSDVVAVGNPCRVLRPITEEDMR